jgi:uncharacterized protein
VINVYLRNIHYNGEIYLDYEKGSVEIEVAGHSDAGVKGGDIVCASVSVIAQTAVLAVNRVARVRQDIEQRDGFLKSVLHVEDISVDSLDALRIILEVTIIGLEEIRRLYPGRVDVVYR